MRMLVAAAVGLAVCTLKVLAWFHLWALPVLFDLAGFGGLLWALVWLLVAVKRKAGVPRAGAIAVAWLLAALDLPVMHAISMRRIDQAQAYCAEVAACVDASCAARPEHGFPVVPGRDAPEVFQPGFSSTHQPSFDVDDGGAHCTFPDVIPGHQYWRGDRPPGGAWSWDMDD